MSKLYKTKEVATRLHISEQYVRKLVVENNLVIHKTDGGHRRFNDGDIQKLQNIMTNEHTDENKNLSSLFKDHKSIKERLEEIISKDSLSDLTQCFCDDLYIESKGSPMPRALNYFSLAAFILAHANERSKKKYTVADIARFYRDKRFRKKVSKQSKTSIAKDAFLNRKTRQFEKLKAQQQYDRVKPLLVIIEKNYQTL